MIIISIKFRGSEKTYDYALDSTDYNVDFTKDIKIIRGVRNNTPIYSTAHVVNVSSVNAPPAHVHTKLLAGNYNQLTPVSIGYIEENKTVKSPAKIKTIPKAKPKRTVSLTQLYNELKAINRNILAKENEIIKLQDGISEYNLYCLFKKQGIFDHLNIPAIATEEQVVEANNSIALLKQEKDCLLKQKQQQQERITEYWR